MARQKGGKDKSRECQRDTDTVDVDATPLARDSKKMRDFIKILA